jgi:hypothetical protein
MIRQDYEQAYGSLDAVINTPGSMMDKADAVNASMNILAQDISESVVTDSFKMGWATFKKSWDDFYADLGGIGGWVNRLWAGTLEDIESYQNRLVDWQNQFKAYGGIVVGPAAEKLPEQPSAASLLGNIKWIVIGVAVVYGAFTFGPVIKKVIGGRK